MPITTVCTSCHARLTLGDDVAGKKIKCPRCGSHRQLSRQIWNARLRRQGARSDQRRQSRLPDGARRAQQLTCSPWKRPSPTFDRGWERWSSRSAGRSSN